MISRTAPYVVTPKNLNVQSNMARKVENENTIRTLMPDKQPEKSKRSESVTGCRRKTPMSTQSHSIYSQYGETGQSSMRDIINHVPGPMDTRSVSRSRAPLKNDESVECVKFDRSPSRVRKLQEQTSAILLHGPVEMKKLAEPPKPNFKDKQHNSHFQEHSRLYFTTQDR